MAAVINFLITTWTTMYTLIATHLPVVIDIWAGILGIAFGTWSARRYLNTRGSREANGG